MCLCSRAWCRARAAGEKFVCVSARSAVGQPFVYSRRVVAIIERTPKCLTNYKFFSELTRLPKIFSTRKGNVTSLEASPMHRISEKGWTFAIIHGVGRNDSKRLTGNLERLSILDEEKLREHSWSACSCRSAHIVTLLWNTLQHARECDKVMQICPWEHMGDWNSSRDDGKFS